MKMENVVTGALLAGLFAGCAAEWEKKGEITFAVRGRPPAYTIVLPAEPSPSQVTAAEELRRHVAEMTGVSLAVETNTTPQRAIFLGGGDASLGDDGFRLRVTPPHLRIEGGKVHGTLFGVYDFLERYCGCEWFAPDTSVIPKKDRLVVSATLDDVQKPAFMLRDMNWTDQLRDWRFTAKLKMNGFRTDYPEELGGQNHRKDKSTGGSTFDALMPPAKHFKEHPEWFSLRDGIRVEKSQRCLTNAEFLDFLVKQTRERVAKNYPKCKYYGLYQNDWKHACECEGCKAIDTREGTPMGTMLHMANYVAERIAKDYPEARILTFSYMYTLKPPKTMKVHPNVTIVYCTDAVDFSKPILSSRCKGDREFVENFKAWRKLTPNIYIWDYSANFKYLFMPFECVHVMPENFRFFRDVGVSGVFEEGDHYETHCVDEALKTWMIGHLLWNPDQPLEPLLDRFFKGYYGAAAGVARGYYDALCELEKMRDEAKEPLVMWGTRLEDTYHTPAFFAEWSEKWTAALDLVKDDPVSSNHVYWARHNVDLAGIMRTKGAKKHSLVKDPVAAGATSARLVAAAKRILKDFDAHKGLNGLNPTRDSFRVVRQRVSGTAEFDPHQTPTNVVVLTAKELHATKNYRVTEAKDPLAMDGVALRIDQESLSWQHWCVYANSGDFAWDEGVKIKVRVHARVERTGVEKGDAFTVGTCSLPDFKKRDIRNSHVKIDRVKTDGYAWYDIDGVWAPKGDENIWVANGNYRKNVDKGNPCVKAVFVDAIELTRVDAEQPLPPVEVRVRQTAAGAQARRPRRDAAAG